MRQESAVVELPVVQEPTFQLKRAGRLRQAYWTVGGILGVDVEKSREEYLAEQFTQALALYGAEVDRFGAVVEELRTAYTALTTSLREDEQRIRKAEARLREQYSLDMRMLFHETDKKEPVSRTIQPSELEEVIAELREGLSQLEYEERKDFEPIYGTSLDQYRAAGEHVLFTLEEELLAQTDAGIDYEQLTQKAATLRARREQIFTAYKDARARHASYKNLLELLQVDVQARVSTIQAAAHANRLELGGDLLLQLYATLAPAEALAQAELSRKQNNGLDTQYEVINATTREMKKITGDE